MAVTRNTVQREIVLSTVLSMCNHPSAEEVYDSVSKVDSHISKGTVYRNLALLSLAGKIRKIAMPGTLADRYDFNLKPHFHAVCRKCGKIIDVCCKERAEGFSFSEPFKVEGMELVLSGLCSECDENSSDKSELK